MAPEQTPQLSHRRSAPQPWRTLQASIRADIQALRDDIQGLNDLVGRIEATCDQLRSAHIQTLVYSLRLNETLLSDPLLLKDTTTILTQYFNENVTSDVTAPVVWEAYKCTITGFFIASGTVLKKHREAEISELTNQIQKQETAHKHTTTPTTAYKKSMTVSIFNTAKQVLPLFWKKDIPPPLTVWFDKMEDLRRLEELTFAAQDCYQTYMDIWTHWLTVVYQADFQRLLMYGHRMGL
ncbi:Hypothetical predicted protein [Pelobates cultripes]|uniref:Uncharacterized protein n=1 Tax=Pelobates cultripes TaxID=61616 RepID=A0AAD1R1L0_PELCU|nr:Hypothetical predicted protein [Pelobates cultripes]